MGVRVRVGVGVGVGVWVRVSLVPLGCSFLNSSPQSQSHGKTSSHLLTGDRGGSREITGGRCSVAGDRGRWREITGDRGRWRGDERAPLGLGLLDEPGHHLGAWLGFG